MPGSGRRVYCFYARDACAQEEVAYTFEKGVLKIAEGTTVLSGRVQSLDGFDIMIVELPASLIEVHSNAFDSLNSLQEYRVTPENEFFKAKDGVLFTKDGGKLVRFPSARGGIYTVPDGTGEIRFGAFRDNRKLRELILCEGITSVSGVFEEYALGIADSHAIQKLVLPSTIREVEPFSISGVSLEAIGVAQENPSLYEIDGVLFSKENNQLLVYPQNRKQEHYDVPPGTEGIATGAFAYNGHLKSVSLPRSVKSIGERAFYRCQSLHSVSLPITLAKIDDSAFYHCLHLQYVSIPPLAVVGDKVFAFCPLLSGSENGSGGYEARKSAVYGIVSPENARDTVAVQSLPSASSKELAHFSSGTTVNVLGQEGQFYEIYANQFERPDSIRGYIALQDVEICGTLYGMFKPSTGKLRNSLQSAVYSEMWALPISEEPERFLKPEQSVKIVWQMGQWYGISIAGRWGYIPMNQLTIYTEAMDNGKVYGVVVNEDLRDQLHLREKPQEQSQSLGKYFSGTQVEILGEDGDWYQVKVDFMEGYMMKRFVERVQSEEQ